MRFPGSFDFRFFWGFRLKFSLVSADKSWKIMGSSMIRISSKCFSSIFVWCRNVSKNLFFFRRRQKQFFSIFKAFFFYYIFCFRCLVDVSALVLFHSVFLIDRKIEALEHRYLHLFFVFNPFFFGSSVTCGKCFPLKAPISHGPRSVAKEFFLIQSIHTVG